MENLELVYSFFNQYLFAEAKNNIEHIEYYYKTSPKTAGNSLIEAFLTSIKEYNLESIDAPLFQSILTRAGKNREEQSVIMSEIVKWKHYTKEQIQPAKKYLRDLCAAAIINQANSRYGDSPSEYLAALKKSDLNRDMTDVMSTITIDKMDINSIVADGGTKGFKSSYDWINDAFRPLCAWPAGTINLISCPPGTGKTLFALNEALHMALNGSRVHYSCFGDMKPYTVLWRLCTIYSGIPMYQSAEVLPDLYNQLRSAVGDKFALSISPAGKIKVDEYIDYMLERDDEVIFLDYDSNLEVDTSTGMYEAFGKLYSRLTELSAQGKLVFVLAQPHKNSWGNELITLDQIGESSKKIHFVDFCLTGSTRPDCPNALGKFSIQKNRQGDMATHSYVRLNNGHFKFIPKGLYSYLLSFPEKHDWTEAEMDDLVRKYKGEAANLERQAEAQGQTGGIGGPAVQARGKIENPFQK